jgi:NAD(P)-dependent dehydrogenase (short-subunit alcohol dehydrogenase family)
MGVPHQTVYAVMKAATKALVRVWAAELGIKYGIIFNAVAPGLITAEIYYASDQGFLDSMQPLASSMPAAYRVGVEQVSDVVPIVA